MNADRPDEPRDQKSARRAAWAFGVLLTAAVGILLAHEGHAPLPTKGAQVDAAKGQVTLSKEARDALDLQTAEVKTLPVEEYVPAYATVAAPWRRHAFASSRLGGRIAKLHAKPGQQVEAGEVLAEVKSLELETLQQELLAAKNDSRLSAKIVAGLEEARGAVPEQTILEARNRHRQNLNALEVGRVKWASLGLPADALETLLRTGKPSLETLPVRTPVAGTVVHADLSVGRVVELMEHLFEVVDVSAVWVKVGVLEKDLYRVAEGRPVELRLAARPGEVFETKVSVVGLDLDPVTHLGTAWAELTNPPGEEPKVLPGMTGQARVLLPPNAKALAVPAEAVVEDGAETYVLVEEAAVAGGSQFQKRNVVPGRRAGGLVEVRPGEVFPGDRVVTRGGHQLASFFVPGVLRPSPEAARTMGLAVEAASPRPVGEVLEIDASVDLPPSARASASSHLAGTLVKILVDRGQKVEAGQVLAEVQSLALQDLQLELLRAHLDGELLEDTFTRLKAARDAVPRRRLLEAEGQVLANRQSRETLRRKLLLAGLEDADLDRLLAKKAVATAVPVRSPIAGVVVSFDRVLGQAVKAEEPLFTVHDLSRPMLLGHLSEREAARVRVGQSARVRLNADPSYLAEGKVVRGGRVFGAESRTAGVWVELNTPPSQVLRQGQLARLTVLLSGADASQGEARSVALPLTALVREGTRHFVFVKKEDGSFERRAVEVGRTDDIHVEVTGGLKAGEPVAVRGADRLQTAFAVVR